MPLNSGQPDQIAALERQVSDLTNRVLILQNENSDLRQVQVAKNVAPEEQQLEFDIMDQSDQQVALQIHQDLEIKLSELMNENVVLR